MSRESLPPELCQPVVTMGNFDGLHLGHRQLIRRLVQRSRERSVPSLVATFSPHPVQVLRPEIGLRRLFPIEDLMEQLQRESVDFLMILEFTRDLSETPAQAFLMQTFIEPLRPLHFVVGYDFRFGNRRQGDMALLQSLGEAHQFTVEQETPFELDGQIVSSSLVRRALAERKLEAAARLLGRPFSISGKVVHGRKLGRKLGFPTANLEESRETLPDTGVYIAKAQVEGVSYGALVNIGHRPTVEQDEARAKLSVEAHLLEGFSEDLYGKTIKLSLLHFLRPETKFSLIEELVVQIQRDKEEALRWLKKGP